jgi:hypothetical protein
VTSPFTSATARRVTAEVEYDASAPPAPVDDVHEIDQSIVIRVRKWYPSTGDVDDAFRYVYEHAPGAVGT